MRCDEPKEIRPQTLPTSLREIIKQVGTNLQRKQHNHAHETKKEITRHTALRTSRINKMLAESKIFWWPNVCREIEGKTKNCVACIASGKNLNYQMTKNNFGKLKKLTEQDKKLKLILPEN